MKKESLDSISDTVTIFSSFFWSAYGYFFFCHYIHIQESCVLELECVLNFFINLKSLRPKITYSKSQNPTNIKEQ